MKKFGLLFTVLMLVGLAFGQTYDGWHDREFVVSGTADIDTVEANVLNRNLDANQKMITDLGTLKTDSVTSNTGDLILRGVGTGGVDVDSLNGLKITTGTNTFNLARGTGSLDVAADATLNIDKGLTVNGNAGTLTYSAASKTATVEDNVTIGLDVNALEGLASTGLVARTAANTYSERTVTGTAQQITVTNGNGVSGNPTVSLPANVSITGIVKTGKVDLKNQTALESTIGTDSSRIYFYDDGSTIHLMATKDDNATETQVKLAEQSSITNLSAKGAGYYFNGSAYVSIGDVSSVLTIYSLSIHFYLNSAVTSALASGSLIGTRDYESLDLGSSTGSLANELITFGTTSKYSYWADATYTIPAGKHTITLVWDGSKYQIYLDGIARTTSTNGTPELIPPNKLVVGGRWTTSYVGSFNGCINSVLFFNNAFTTAEVKEISEYGVPQKYKGASKTELMPNQVDRDFSGASAWADVDLVAGGGAYGETDDLTITAGAAGAGDYCTCPVLSMPTTIGLNYSLKFDVANLVGTWTIKSFDGTQTIGTVSATGLQQELTWVATTTGGLRIVAVSNLASADFDNFTLRHTGCVAEYLPQNITAATWYDASSNGLDGTNSGSLVVGADVSKLIRNAESDATAGGLVFDKSRARATIITGDDVGYIIAKAHDGTDYHDGIAKIDFLSSGTIAANRTPGQIDFYTAADAAGSALTKRWSILNSGIMQSNGAQTLQTSSGNLSLTGGGTGYISVTDSLDVVSLLTAGSMVSDATIAATTTMTTGANSGTSGQVNFIASDNDQANIAINTSDQIVFTGAGGGVVAATGTPILVGTTQWDASATDSINGAVIAAGTVPALSLALAKDLVTTSPLAGGVNNILPGADSDVTLSIADAAADGATKGAAAFATNDFEATTGVISIDYTNGQAATTGAKGFLTNTDWNTFNGKQPGDATLTALAGLIVTDVSVIEGTGTDAVAMVASGGNNYILGSNAGNTALEFKAPADVLSQIGASPVAGSSSITTTGTVTSGGLGTGAVLGGVTMTLGSDADYDMYYRASNLLTRLAPNTVASQKFLAMTGTGAAGQAPSWESVSQLWTDDASQTYLTQSAEPMEFRKTGLAHGMTTLSNTDAYAHFNIIDATDGGLRIIGLSNTADVNGVHLASAMVSDTPTDYPMKFSVATKATTTWAPFSGTKLGFAWYNDTQLIGTLNTAGNMTLSNNSATAAKNYHQLSLYHSAPTLCLTDYNINTSITSAATAQDTNAIWLDADDTTPEIGFSNSTGNSFTLGIDADGDAVMSGTWKNVVMSAEVWVTSASQNPALVTLPANAKVLSVECWVSEAFNSDSDDLIRVGNDAATDAYCTDIDVSSTGVKSATLGATALTVDATSRSVEVYYTNGGSEPEAGKAHIVLTWIQSTVSP